VTVLSIDIDIVMNRESPATVVACAAAAVANTNIHVPYTQRNSTAALHSAVLTSLCIAAVFIAVHRRNNLCAVHRRRISDLVIKNYFARISNIKLSIKCR